MLIDLFHPLVYESPEGYKAISDFTEHVPHTRVYTPDGTWCGSTDAEPEIGMLARVKGIIRWHINYLKINYH